MPHGQLVFVVKGIFKIAFYLYKVLAKTAMGLSFVLMFWIVITVNSGEAIDQSWLSTDGALIGKYYGFLIALYFTLTTPWIDGVTGVSRIKK